VHEFAPHRISGGTSLNRTNISVIDHAAVEPFDAFHEVYPATP
jgi:hypothetical protein